MLLLLYGPTLTSICDHWEDQSLDYKDLCRQSNVSAFQHTVQVCHRLPAKKQTSSDFTAAVATCSNFGAEEEESGHHCHLSPSMCQAAMGLDAVILLFFLIFSFMLALSLSSFTLTKRLSSSSSLSAIRVISSHT